MKKEQLKKEILNKAYLPMSSELAREYFNLLGLRIESVKLNQCKILSNYIQKEIDILLKDGSYNMIDKLRMNPKIKSDKFGIFLFTDGYYFKKRQAVSFEFSNDSEHKFIGFCGWASGCNRIPFIKGFVKWCDTLTPNPSKNHEAKR